MLTRNLLYTALSRAKRRVVVVGNPDTFERAVQTPGSRRYGGLNDRLARSLPPDKGVAS
jgi:exodeoxyribonuclease V alpha subunit